MSAPAVDALLADADAALERAVGPDVAADYDAMSAVLDVATERLGRAWGAVSHLNAVADTPELRAAYNAEPAQGHRVPHPARRRRAAVRQVQGHRRQPGGGALAAPRRKALANALRDFVLSGAELQGDAKARFAAIQERAADLEQQYREHVLDATDGFAYFARSDELDGVPADVLQATREAATAEGKEGHKLTLHYPVYGPVMQYASNRRLRETLYTAYVTRASELGPSERDNGPLMQALLALRQEAAALLGHASYAEVSLVPKMARSTQEVASFLRDLATPRAALCRTRPGRAVGLCRVGAGSARVAGLGPGLRQRKAQGSALRLQRPGGQALLHRAAGAGRPVRDRADGVRGHDHPRHARPVWHDSVRFYRVERDGQLLAQFYLDPYARPGKQPGAWMDDVRVRWARPDGTLQTPVATLTCNFAPPVGNEPALLTHDDVITLFHEFGHGLHLMLTRIDDIGVSGLSGVEWDAVELPSQFMENFCWEWSVLERLTAHVESGAALPRALFDKMVAAKNFQSGLGTLRQVEMGLFDMRIHGEPGADQRVQHVLDEVRREVGVLEPPAFNRFQHSFSHIFAGGYSAGYYSYKWAEVLSADAWSAFEEAGALSVATGRRLREEILEAGGSRSALENFTAFRGREPRIDALLRHQGMA